MTTARPIVVRCPRCGDFKAELRQPGDGGTFQCCKVRWEQRLLEVQ